MPDDDPTPPEQDADGVRRRPYVAPTLRVYGDLRKLTRGGMGLNADAGVKPTHV